MSTELVLVYVSVLYDVPALALALSLATALALALAHGLVVRFATWMMLLSVVLMFMSFKFIDAWRGQYYQWQPRYATTSMKIMTSAWDRKS